MKKVPSIAKQTLTAKNLKRAVFFRSCRQITRIAITDGLCLFSIVSIKCGSKIW